MTREQSAIVKGIAILMMLLYHSSFIGPVNAAIHNAVGATIGNASNPISYFLIVSGYGLYLAYHNKRVSWKYLFKRTARLYLAFWIVLALFVFGLGNMMYPGRFPMSWDMIIANMTGYRWDYCQFTWFLLPYVLMTFSAKWIFWLTDHIGDIVMLLLTGALYLASTWLISRFYDSWLRFNYPIYHIVLVVNLFFSLTIGSVMARCSLKGNKLTWNKLKGKNIYVALLFIVSFIVRGQIHFAPLNPIYCAFVVWLVLHLELPQGISKIFVELGNKSMVMWLAQGFLGVMLFSEYISMIKNPVLAWLAWLAVTYLVASFILPVSNCFARKLKLC